MDKRVEDAQDEEKLIENDNRDEVLQRIDDGTYELFIHDGGYSDAWEKFWRIRNPKAKELIEYVQCMECKVLLTFKKYSGTTHLNRHKCRKGRGLNDDGTCKFKCLTSEKTDELKSSITKDIIKVCAEDLISPEILCESAAFLRFSQKLISMGYKDGNVESKNIFPNSYIVRRDIVDMKEEKLRESYFKFREAMKNKWCSGTIEVRMFISTRADFVLIMSVQFFDPNLKALTKNVIFTTSIADGQSSIIILQNLLEKFKLFGGDEETMQNLKIVTPNIDVLQEALAFPYTRYNCAADTITKILDEAFVSSGSKDVNDLISNCRSIVSLTEKHNLKLDTDIGTWKSKISMIRSVLLNYADIAKILENENKNILKVNKRRAEELIDFLGLFEDAIDDLSSTSYPTANKILLWWSFLTKHLEECDEYSLEVKKIVTTTKGIFGLKFQPTMENKIDCFLDPRYKSLVMLTKNDRDVVIEETRKLLDNELENVNVVEPLPGPSNVRLPKRNRFAIYESAKGISEKSTKKCRFECYEASVTDKNENDEIKIYLDLPVVNSKSFKSEFGIISEFWKSRKNVLPKLFKLAITRLHVPACCGSAGLKDTNLNHTLDIETVNDLLLVRGQSK